VAFGAEFGYVRDVKALPIIFGWLVLTSASACGPSDAQRAWCDSHATEVAVTAVALGLEPPGVMESWEDWLAIGPESRDRYGYAPARQERACSAAYEGR
jgi:hypothetical protein